MTFKIPSATVNRGAVAMLVFIKFWNGSLEELIPGLMSDELLEEILWCDELEKKNGHANEDDDVAEDIAVELLRTFIEDEEAILLDDETMVLEDEATLDDDFTLEDETALLEEDGWFGTVRLPRVLNVMLSPTIFMS